LDTLLDEIKYEYATDEEIIELYGNKDPPEQIETKIKAFDDRITRVQREHQKGSDDLYKEPVPAPAAPDYSCEDCSHRHLGRACKDCEKMSHFMPRPHYNTKPKSDPRDAAIARLTTELDQVKFDAMLQLDELNGYKILVKELNEKKQLSPAAVEAWIDQHKHEPMKGYPFLNNPFIFIEDLKAWLAQYPARPPALLQSLFECKSCWTIQPALGAHIMVDPNIGEIWVCAACWENPDNHYQDTPAPTEGED
jgi:hypothetical protein